MITLASGFFFSKAARKRLLRKTDQALVQILTRIPDPGNYKNQYQQHDAEDDVHQNLFVWRDWEDALDLLNEGILSRIAMLQCEDQREVTLPS
jgi:hypothetical protein